MSSKHTLRKDTSVYLIGHYTPQIIGNKLPSNGQVLSVLFFNLREVKLTLRESATLAIKEVLIFWNKARIPTRDQKHCIEKLEILHQNWRSLQKDAKKSHEILKQREQLFVSQLDDLFDIAHANASEMMSIEEDKQFLVSQRQKGRPGFMCGIDVKLAEREKRADERRSKEIQKLQLSTIDADKSRQIVELQSSSSTEEESIVEADSEAIPSCSKDSFGIPHQKKKKLHGTRNIITPKMVAAFDKCKVSDRNAVHILMATAEALGQDVRELSISRSSIQRCRQRIRQERAAKLKERFKKADLQAVVVHWDGKLLPAVTGSQMVERLPIVITSGNIEQILEIPQLQGSTGKEQALAVYGALTEWDLTDKVKALCCDTTASNLGYLNGASVILEHMLERDLLYFPCRHHIFEIVLKSVFELKLPTSSGPDVQIFKRFQQAWPKINKNNFKPGIEEAKVREILSSHQKEIQSVITKHLQMQQPRDDYKELLELAQVFIGNSTKDISFRAPGAYHHARWMSKALYCLKIFLFRGEFKLTSKENKGLSDICLFLVIIYIRAWFTAPFAQEAPTHDIQFLKKLVEYESVDQDISHISIHKFKNHLWYLSSEACALAFFDESLSVETKTKMVQNLARECNQETGSKRIVLKNEDVDGLINKSIEDFISADSKHFFERFNVPTDFLNMDPASWSENESYKTSSVLVHKLKVVNDTAERGIKLIQDYNKIIAKNEDQKQFLLQVVADYRRQYPDAKKETVAVTMK